MKSEWSEALKKVGPENPRRFVAAVIAVRGADVLAAGGAATLSGMGAIMRTPGLSGESKTAVLVSVSGGAGPSSGVRTGAIRIVSAAGGGSGVASTRAGAAVAGSAAGAPAVAVDSSALASAVCATA